MDTLQVLPMGVDLAVKILIALNSAWNLLNFRSGLIKAFVAQGHTLVLVAPKDENVQALENLDTRFVDMPINSHSINPMYDLVLLWRYMKLLREEKPDVIFTFTVKPNVYCSLAARFLNIPVINNISGLGSVFIKDGWVAFVLRALYKISLARSNKVFFQNPDDLKYFLTHRLVNERFTALLPGSGVDLQRFKPTELPYLNQIRKKHTATDSQFVFLLVCRMLKEKGIEEYVHAARLLKQLSPNVIFALLGPIDNDNPSAISESQMQFWVNEGAVSYWGSTNDVRIQIAKADCIVLPSYREGTPRSLLEAAAMSRPLVASNVPGCREVIQDGVNGFMCLPRNAHSLASAMKNILNLSSTTLKSMGRASRHLAEIKFDEQIVIKKYINSLEEINR
jgi:glycosyltransferase involved in cell wall biosynthesis